MSSDELLYDLLAELDRTQAADVQYQRYVTGTQALAWIGPESRKAMGNRLPRMASNLCSLALSSLTERMRVVGFSNPEAFRLYCASDLDQLASRAMFDALCYSRSFILVWSADDRPTATVENPRMCAVLRHPATRVTTAGIKRWSDKQETHAMVYLDDRVEHWVAGTPNAASGFTLRESFDHDFGIVPLVILDNGRSELDDLMPLCDSLNKLLVDMLTASEAAGKPRRWISGLELVEKPRLDEDGSPVLSDDGEPVVDVVSPIDNIDTVKTMISEDKDTKFGQLPATDLQGFKDGVQILLSQIMAVSALPSHYLGILTSQPTSADALRASEASLTARAESKQLLFGKAIELVGKLLLSVETGRPVSQIDLRVLWGPADTRSEAQVSDSVYKLVSAGILSRSGALRRLGYSEQDIERELDDVRRDAQLGQDIKLGRFMSDLTEHRGN